MGNWIGDCLIGKSQSPVALTMDESMSITLEPLFFEFYDQLPRCQFHQHFTRAYFVQKSFVQLFFYYCLAL
jgi:hypothetical protein